MVREELIAELKKEVTRSLLLKDEDKNFWILEADSLPDIMLEKVLSTIRDKNLTADKYLRAVLAEDKDHKYLTELRDKIKKIKEKAFAMEEAGQKGGAEEILKEELKNI